MDHAIDASLVEVFLQAARSIYIEYEEGCSCTVTTLHYQSPLMSHEEI